jgi:hypothetical protein
VSNSILSLSELVDHLHALRPVTTLVLESQETDRVQGTKDTASLTYVQLAERIRQEAPFENAGL